jgi:hypothetical protein
VPILDRCDELSFCKSSNPRLLVPSPNDRGCFSSFYVVYRYVPGIISQCGLCFDDNNAGLNSGRPTNRCKKLERLIKSKIVVFYIMVKGTHCLH